MTSGTRTRCTGKISSTGATDAEEVCWAKNWESFRASFISAATNPAIEIVAVFFDNDIGSPNVEGRHLFSWMEKYIRENGVGPFVLHAQTANPAAKRELLGGFGSLRRFWGLD